MHKQCVPDSFFSSHTQEPGNEAKPSLYAAARVAQLNIRAVVAQCGMQSLMTSSVKLENNNVPAFWPT